jgi:mRNA interferase MazF
VTWTPLGTSRPATESVRPTDASAGRAVRRWDLFRVDLEPIVGSEQGGFHRPALIISGDVFNRHFPIVTVLPLTGTRGKRRRVYPFEVVLDQGIAGNPEESIAMPQQIRTVSKARLRGRLGRLTDGLIRQRIERRLLEHLAIEFEIAGPESDV